MILAEMRGLVAVVVVGILIALLFVRISEYGEDESVAAASVTTSTSSTTTSSTTTTEAPPLFANALAGIQNLCESAEDFVLGAESDIEFPGKVPQLAEEFYTKVVDGVDDQVRAEYSAALRYYTEYNDLALPFNYDGLSILQSDGGQRWGLLASSEPPGVEATRANVAFLCGGLEIPEPPLLSASEFERLSDLADG